MRFPAYRPTRRVGRLRPRTDPEERDGPATIGRRLDAHRHAGTLRMRAFPRGTSRAEAAGRPSGLDRREALNVEARFPEQGGPVGLRRWRRLVRELGRNDREPDEPAAGIDPNLSHAGLARRRIRRVHERRRKRPGLRQRRSHGRSRLAVDERHGVPRETGIETRHALEPIRGSAGRFGTSSRSRRAFRVPRSEGSPERVRAGPPATSRDRRSRRCSRAATEKTPGRVPPRGGGEAVGPSTARARRADPPPRPFPATASLPPRAAACRGSPPGSAAATCAAEDGRCRGSFSMHRRIARSTAGSIPATRSDGLVGGSSACLRR